MPADLTARMNPPWPRRTVWTSRVLLQPGSVIRSPVSTSPGRTWSSTPSNATAGGRRCHPVGKCDVYGWQTRSRASHCRVMGGVLAGRAHVTIRLQPADSSVGLRGRARILGAVEHRGECNRLARPVRRAPVCDRPAWAAEEAERAEAAEIDGLAVRAVRRHRQLGTFRAAGTLAAAAEGRQDQPGPAQPAFS